MYKEWCKICLYRMVKIPQSQLYSNTHKSKLDNSSYTLFPFQENLKDFRIGYYNKLYWLLSIVIHMKRLDWFEAFSLWAGTRNNSTDNTGSCRMLHSPYGRLIICIGLFCSFFKVMAIYRIKLPKKIHARKWQLKHNINGIDYVL